MITHFNPSLTLQNFPVLNLGRGVHHVPGKAMEDSFNSFKTLSKFKQLCLSDLQSGTLKMLPRDIQSTQWLPLISLMMRILRAKIHHGRHTQLPQQSRCKAKLAVPHLLSLNPVINLALNCLPHLVSAILLAPYSLPGCHPMPRCTRGESLTVCH